MDSKTRIKSKSDPGPEPNAGSKPCCVIRTLLRREVLTTSSFDEEVLSFASIAREALRAGEALVAFYDSDSGSWTACTSDGQRLRDDSISLFGSRAVLEQVRHTGQPIITSWEAPLILESESLSKHQVQSVLAVPIHFWSVTEPRQTRSFGGCLYAHRSRSEAPFEPGDVELISDLTELAQRTLNLIRHLKGVEADLAASAEELGRLRKTATQRFRLGAYETRDPWFAENVLEPLQRVSYASKVGLLLQGPTGSGKTFLAEAYHRQCPRKDQPFVVLDCAQALSAETLGPELFGYAKDSGYANAPRKGLLGKAELAHRGTLFIDEIGLLPWNLQQKLLRLIQDGVFAPLGTSEEKRVDIQIIAASNEDLASLVQQGRFREDLFHRLRELTVELPNLSDRAADIPQLAAVLFEEARQRFGRDDLARLAQSAVEALLRHDWSGDGNIRGLAQTISRSVLMAPSFARELASVDIRFSTAKPRDSRKKPFRSNDSAVAPRVNGPEEQDRELRKLMETKIRQYHGNVAQMGEDPDLVRDLGRKSGSLPLSTLRAWIRRLALTEMVEDARQSREAGPSLQQVRDTIVRTGSLNAAAEELGLSRHQLVWQLRTAGLKVREILRASR